MIGGPSNPPILAMPRLLCLLIALLCLPVIPAAAQFTDDFSDGDFTGNPAWIGTTDRFSITPLDGDPALRSDGAAASDTIYLATPSEVSRGAWSFTFAPRGVNLSNFNGARVFLTANTEVLDGNVLGYYLQFGASNSDEVRLYRQDGDPATSRVLLGQSDEPLLEGDSTTLAVTVTRSETYEWTVSVDGLPVLTATDGVYTSGRFFGVWVKHTQAAAQDFFFDDFDVAGEAGPTDRNPPQLIGAAALDAERVEVTFNEPVEGCFPDRYEISNGIGRPSDIETCLPEGQAAYVLHLARPLANGATYTLIAREVADRAGNVLAEASASFTFIEPGGPPPVPSEVIVNEILYDAPDAALEFVEFFNRSDKTFDLSRFRFSDDRLQSVTVSEEPRALAPGAYAVLARDGAAFSAAFPGVAFIEPSSWPALNNGGDAVVLFFNDTVIDAVAYLPSWGGDGVSLERRDPNGPSNSRFNFGSAVAVAGATPGVQNSLFAPDLAPPRMRFAEQVDEDAVDVYLDEPVAPESAQAAIFTLDDGRAPERLFLDEEGTLLRLRFAASLSGVRLRVSGLRDLTGNTLTDAAIDLAYLARPGDLVINEILYDPLADRFDNRPDQPEYVEVLNRSARALTLRRYYWTNAPDEAGIADTLRFGAGFYALAPDRLAVVFADADDPDEPAVASTLTRAFPGIDFSTGEATLLPLARSSLSLTNSGALIHLHRPDDVGLDSVYYDPAWHHPNLVDATGVALERIAPEGRANDPANWTSSVAEAGGTPGRANSVVLSPGAPVAEGGLVIDPSPFSPDRDGHDDVTALRYTLPQEAALVRVRIFDAEGRLVRSLEEARLVSRSGHLLWDGLDDAGRALRIGIYVVLFEALDTAGGTTAVFKEPVVLARPLD